MDVQYLFLQVLLLMVIFVGIRYASCMKEANLYRFLKTRLPEEGFYLYNRLAHHIGKEKIHAAKQIPFIIREKINSYYKYEMWRYIEHRRETSFIHEYYNMKENVINGDYSTNI